MHPALIENTRESLVNVARALVKVARPPLFPFLFFAFLFFSFLFFSLFDFLENLEAWGTVQLRTENPHNFFDPLPPVQCCGPRGALIEKPERPSALVGGEGVASRWILVARFCDRHCTG